MEMQFSVKGSERKVLAGAIGEILGQEAVYNGAPTFAYTVGGYMIDKDGVMHCPDDANQEKVEKLLAALKERGYSDTSGDTCSLTVEIPRDGFILDQL